MKLHISSTRMPNPVLALPTLVGRPVLGANVRFPVPALFMAITQPVWSMIGLPLVAADRSRLCWTTVLFPGVTCAPSMEYGRKAPIVPSLKADKGAVWERSPSSPGKPTVATGCPTRSWVAKRLGRNWAKCVISPRMVSIAMSGSRMCRRIRGVR